LFDDGWWREGFDLLVVFVFFVFFFSLCVFFTVLVVEQFAVYILHFLVHVFALCVFIFV
jgi:hypothetical protein